MRVVGNVTCEALVNRRILSNSHQANGDDMATSSITPNFEIKDPSVVRAIVDAFLSSEPWPQPQPTVRADRFASDDDAHRFFRRSPYAQTA